MSVRSSFPPVVPAQAGTQGVQAAGAARTGSRGALDPRLRGDGEVVARRAALVVLAAALAGCASAPRIEPPPGVQSWSGRLALTVEGRSDQSFSAAFDLQGAPQAGELRLYNPLGGTVGVLAWQPGVATLRTNGSMRQFGSLDEVVTQVTGAAIPVPALFDWLAGRPTEVPGWTVDLSQVAQGRLRARRVSPTPAADLRIAFGD